MISGNALCQLWMQQRNATLCCLFCVNILPLIIILMFLAIMYYMTMNIIVADEQMGNSLLPQINMNMNT